MQRSNRVEPDLKSYGELDGSVIADILVGDGSRFHIRGMVFDMRTFKSTEGSIWGSKHSDRSMGLPMLRAYSGFHDNTWYNASSLRYGGNETTGHLLVVDKPGNRIYGVRGYKKYDGASYQEDVVNVGAGGYSLYATGLEEATTTQDRKAMKSKQKPLWTLKGMQRGLAMVAGRDRLCLVSVEDKVDPADPWKYYEGRAGGVLTTYAAADGSELYEMPLVSAPVYDGLSAARNQLFLSCRNGQLLCFKEAD